MRYSAPKRNLDDFSFSIAANQKDSNCKTFYPFAFSQEHFKEKITSQIWSPIVFKNDYRKRVNFEKSHLLTFDFDQGTTLEEAVDHLQNWGAWGVIGLSRNHQLEKSTPSGKVSPPCDRFRMILKAGSWCEDLDQYEFTMKRYIEKLKCDSCGDGGRMFYPCTRIFYSQEGEPVDWLLLPKEFHKKKTEKILRKKNTIKTHTEKGVIPKWVLEKLRFGAPVGRRKSYCYSVAWELAEYGYHKEEIINVIMNSPLADCGEKEVIDAANGGYRKANQSFGGHG